MKKIFISLLFVLPFLFSCQPQVDPYTPGEEDVAGCYGVYFPSQAATGSHTLDPTMAPQVTFTAMRKNTSGAITVPLTATASENVFDVGALTFADGQSESSFTVSFPNAENGTTYNLSIAIDDPQYASKYLGQPIALDYSVMRVEWNYFLNPKTGEKAKVHWVQNWWGEEVDTYIKYYEVNGVRTCFTETIPDSHYYKGYYTGYGFFGTADAEGEGEWQFIWYPKLAVEDGQAINLVSQNTGYYNSNYSSYVWVYDRWGYYQTLSPGSNPGYSSFEQMAKNGEPVGYYDGNGGFYLYVTYYYMTGIGGWSQNAYDLAGVAEGYTRVDYSIEAETDYSHNGEVPVYLTLGPDVAKVIYCAYPGELTPTQIENKAAAIAADDNSEVIKDFEAGEGVQYADFTLDLGTTGFYTFVGVTYDANGGAHEVASVLLNYVSADDEETYKVIVDCGTEEVPDRYTGYTPQTSFAYYVLGEDLTEAHVAVYTMDNYEQKLAAVLNDIKTKHAVSADVLAQINANGGWFTVQDGLKADTEYVVLVWATNGKEEAYVADTWKTEALPYVWNYLGQGQLTDDVCTIFQGIEPTTVRCDVYEEENHPGLFKISGYQLPLVAAIFEESEETMAEYEGGNWVNTEVIIDAQNPDDVFIELQDYGVCLGSNYGFQSIASVIQGEKASSGTFKDGVIAFTEENGLYTGLAGSFYYVNGSGAFKVVLPVANAEETAAPAKSNFKKDAQPKADRLYKVATNSFERGEIKSVKSTIKMIEHKAKKASREINCDKF